MNLDDLFKPKSIAVIGATPKKNFPWSSGNSWIVGALKQGFPGAIYPVHPKAKNILGFKAYASILDIPDEIDLAIFTVPIAAVVQLMEECAQKGVKYIHLLTAGFSETGRDETKDIEKRLVEIAKKNNIRLIGPNCMGLYCPEGGIAWNKEFPTTPGKVGFFSQSGQLAHNVVQTGSRLKLYFSKVVSFGNACDLQPNHFLSYLAQDESTGIIGAYLEGLKDGPAFFEAAKAATQKKPVVIWKGGQTEGGSRATLSHTAAIAGSFKVWEAFCKQTGVIPASSAQEMAYTMQALKFLPLPKRTNVAIIGGAGGGSVAMTDLAEKEGLKVPHLTDETIQKLEAFIPLEGSSVKNPLDILPALFIPGNMERIMELLRDDPNIDALICDVHPGWIYKDFGRKALYHYLDLTVKSTKIFEKPTFFVLNREENLEMEAIRTEAKEWLHEADMATFSDFSLAARIMHRMKVYNDYLSALK